MRLRKLFIHRLHANGARPLWPGAVVLALASGLIGCGEQPAPLGTTAPDVVDLKDVADVGASGWHGPRDTSKYSPEVARSWFDLSYDLVKGAAWSPPVASRFWAYAGVTLYEAVRPGMPSYRSLATQLNGLGQLPRPNGAAYHWPTVANAALHVTFANFFSTAPQATRDQIEVAYAKFADEFRADLPPGLFKKSERFGEQVGAAVLAWAAADGFATLNNCAYTPPVGPGLWVPTPPAFAAALQPCWGQLRTSVIDAGSSCDPVPPPPYSTVPGSDFYNEGLEVFNTTSSLTAEQMTIARFWADSPGQTGTPPGHWIAIVGQLIEQLDLQLDVAAEAYAKVGLSVQDAFITCWFTKYEHNLLRPITYIRAVFSPGWTPLIGTPPFPEYTSGHSTQSGAVAHVLTDLFGNVAFTDHTHDVLGFMPRSFDSFAEAADEAAISRLYGGIHYRAAIDIGLDQGRCVGDAVLALNWKLSS